MTVPCNNTTLEPLSWPEVVTLSLFLESCYCSRNLVMVTTLSGSWVRICIFPCRSCIGENIHHWSSYTPPDENPQGDALLKSRTEGVRMPLMWQTPMSAVRFICMLASLHQQIPEKTLCFEEQTCRQLGIFFHQEQRDPDFAIGFCNCIPGMHYGIARLIDPRMSR